MTATAHADARASVVVVDDHPVFRHGLVALLAEDGIDVLAQAGTVADALACVATHRPDVVIMDLHLADGSGVEATRRITAEFPTVALLILTMDGTDAATMAALRAGARGYLLKETAAESIASTVFALARGEFVLDRHLADRIPGILSRPGQGPAVAGFDGLTARDVEILRLVAQGLSNAEIGRRIFLAEKTIRNNVSGLLAKTGLPTRPALIAFARDHDLGKSATEHP
ncbi:response regulator transcription factor [Allobranchiibius sp. CTAmp26]|uniref:response regulator transcription factor n=1 Tax=Allobranchiibius sp. CTAmp26 TaxID=2815214 RepID=UPI001AA18869|nr:response regulator transcription factor [Allobranchiibius sp. CTAmp26]MBO1755695.1 response regulator transcription factor [Allobranchiibius sp. CTAmp26]